MREGKEGTAVRVLDCCNPQFESGHMHLKDNAWCWKFVEGFCGVCVCRRFLSAELTV
jgi:hypothetical protein